MTTLPNVAEWMKRGCNPEDEHAPPIAELQSLERDGLIASVQRFGGTPTWVLTSEGMYEVERVLAVRYREDS